MHCTVIIYSVLAVCQGCAPSWGCKSKQNKVQYSWSLEWMRVGEPKEDLKCRTLVLSTRKQCTSKVLWRPNRRRKGTWTSPGRKGLPVCDTVSETWGSLGVGQWGGGFRGREEERWARDQIMQGFGTRLRNLILNAVIFLNLILKVIGSHLMFSRRGVTKTNKHLEITVLALGRWMD